MQTRAALNFICPIETRNYIFSHDQMMRPWCVAPGPAAMCKITLYEMHFAALGGARGGGGVGLQLQRQICIFWTNFKRCPGQHSQRVSEREKDRYMCILVTLFWALAQLKILHVSGPPPFAPLPAPTCYYCHLMGVMEEANSKQLHQHRKVPLAQC